MKRSLSWIALRLLIVLCVLIAVGTLAVFCSKTVLFQNRGKICAEWCAIDAPENEKEWAEHEDEWLGCMIDCNQKIVQFKYSD